MRIVNLATGDQASIELQVSYRELHAAREAMRRAAVRAAGVPDGWRRQGGGLACSVSEGRAPLLVVTMLAAHPKKQIRLTPVVEEIAAAVEEAVGACSVEWH